MKRTILLFTALLITLTGFTQVSNQRLFDTIPFIPDHYNERMQLFKKQPMTTGQIIFLGNSITEGGPWNELLPDKNILNRGIGGDITFGVLKRLDEIIQRKPTHLFILIGINDIGKDIPDIVIADNCKKIVNRMKAGSPTTKIVLQSILPLNPTVSNFPQHYDKQEHVTNTNRLLRSVAKETGIMFLDLHSIFCDSEKRLKAALTNDGLHLTKKGYDVWTEFLVKKKVFQ
jgi:lysophospholipase L1-like esterase